MATIQDVAQLSGVSKATVSRVITGKAKVMPETLQRVYQAMNQLNFTPNRMAQSLANQSFNRKELLATTLASKEEIAVRNKIENLEALTRKLEAEIERSAKEKAQLQKRIEDLEREKAEWFSSFQETNFECTTESTERSLDYSI